MQSHYSWIGVDMISTLHTCLPRGRLISYSEFIVRVLYGRPVRVQYRAALITRAQQVTRSRLATFDKMRPLLLANGKKRPSAYRRHS